MTPLRLQPLTRARVAGMGATGELWLAGLPGVLTELAQQWSLTLGRPLPGGSSSYVVAARRPDGRPVVVKVALPDAGLAGQVETLRRSDGRGYVRLLDHDPGRHALLLEALGASVDRTGRPAEAQLVLLADTLSRAWRRPEPGDPRPAKAAGLARLIRRRWQQLGRPVSARVVATALEHAEALGEVDAAELVLVHGDPHPANLLQVLQDRPGAETGFCFVDPDGFVADRAYDLGVVLRDWTARLSGPDPRGTLQAYARVLSERSGVDEARIWRWGFVERVSTGLYLTSFGAERMGLSLLDSAERLLARPP